MKSFAMRWGCLITSGMLIAILFHMTANNAVGEISRFSGGSGTVNDPYLISNVDHLQNMNSDTDAFYLIVDDIDCSGTSVWDSGMGFQPVGTRTKPFTGSLDGNGYVIEDLTIKRTSSDYIGLFGWIRSASISNVSMETADISGRNNVGGIAGVNSGGSITNCNFRGTVRGTTYVGGLVGQNYFGGGSIAESLVSADIRGISLTGGIAGMNQAGCSIISSYSEGVVSGDDTTGGVTGDNYGTLEMSFSVSSVRGSRNTGGLCGRNSYGGTIANCYSTGMVSGTSVAGGLVGMNWMGDIANSYATGPVAGTSRIGGLVGMNFGLGLSSGTFLSSYWDKETTGQTTSSGGIGKTTKEMKQQTTFAGWDFIEIWKINEDVTYPLFGWQESMSAEELLENIKDIIEKMDLSAGLMNSLISKIQNALKSLENNNPKAAVNQIRAFINHVKALEGKKTGIKADVLIDPASTAVGLILGSC
jgi:hypothetical protein